MTLRQALWWVVLRTSRDLPRAVVGGEKVWGGGAIMGDGGG